MHSQDLEVLTQVQSWLTSGENPWLCTVTQTIGSSPRPVGSLLAVCNGELVGSLSGGCVEDDLLEKLAAGSLSGTRPALRQYGLKAEENERLGLPCGGTMQVLVEQLKPSKAKWVDQAVTAIQARKCVVRELCLGTGETTLHSMPNFEPMRVIDNKMRQCFGPRKRLLLVGAGQLAHTLSSLALAMDYEVVVTDPREQLLADWSGPNVERVLGLPDEVILQQQVDADTAIITLTHDPRIDDMALLEALESNAGYVGALGSLRTSDARRSRLQALGLSDAAIRRLHAPVGLAIGSKTPWEIAVAIMAELTQQQRQSTGGAISTLNR